MFEGDTGRRRRPLQVGSGGRGGRRCGATDMRVPLLLPLLKGIQDTVMLRKRQPHKLWTSARGSSKEACSLKDQREPQRLTNVDREACARACEHARHLQLLPQKKKAQN